MKITITRLICVRCKHAWVPKQTDIRICPKCKSAFWDRPRKKGAAK